MSRRRHPPLDPIASRRNAAHPLLPEGGVRRRRSQRSARSDATVSLTVADTWPAAVPVTAREIDVVEIYLGQFLDELLREAASGG